MSKVKKDEGALTLDSTALEGSEVATTDVTVPAEVKKQTKPANKNNKNGKSNKKASAKPNVFKKIATAFKEMVSEMKKVTWAKFPAALKNTGVVLMVVLCFLVVLVAFDSLFSWLLSLLVA